MHICGPIYWDETLKSASHVSLFGEVYILQETINLMRICLTLFCLIADDYRPLLDVALNVGVIRLLAKTPLTYCLFHCKNQGAEHNIILDV